MIDAMREFAMRKRLAIYVEVEHSDEQGNLGKEFVKEGRTQKRSRTNCKTKRQVITKRVSTAK